MPKYDVAHIDLARYQELRRQVKQGKAVAIIVVQYLSADASSAVRPAGITRAVDNKVAD